LVGERCGTFYVDCGRSLLRFYAVMMLRRSRHARLAYIVAWIALNISIPYVAGVTGTGVAAVSKASLLADLFVTLAIALYLYLSRGTRQYFRAATE
jgi:hypothetical protein